jgi:hypothetical protein
MADLQLRSIHRDDLDRVSGIESRITRGGPLGTPGTIELRVIKS